MRLPVRVMAAVAPLLMLVGCDEAWFGDSGRFREDFHYSYPLEAGGRFSIENTNGSIEINAWDQDTVEINGTKYAPTEQMLKDIKIDVSAQPSSVSVRTVPAYHFRNGGAKYSIRVPRRVQLDRVVSSNGGIRVYDVEGVARLKSTNGGIRVSRVKGELDARTTNGAIEAVNQSGDAILHTTNGGIHVDMDSGTLEAGTTNGGIEARLAKGDPSKPVRLESTNGHIEVSMDSPRELRANTSNSSIELRMPAEGARVRARTSNSSVQSEFDELSRAMTSKHSLEGTIAGGGPLIDLATSNGHIRLLRR